jgi:hypothetical protein
MDEVSIGSLSRAVSEVSHAQARLAEASASGSLGSIPGAANELSRGMVALGKFRDVLIDQVVLKLAAGVNR